MDKYKQALDELKMKLAFYQVQCNEEATAQDAHRLATLRELIEKQEKYKWHDLRKNPEDLPEVGKAITYLFEVDYGCMVRRIYNSTTATYDGKYHFAKRKCNGNTYTYIAWKYIEPFEEDE